jgi:hypothetical protein
MFVVPNRAQISQAERRDQSGCEGAAIRLMFWRAPARALFPEVSYQFVWCDLSDRFAR